MKIAQKTEQKQLNLYSVKKKITENPIRPAAKTRPKAFFRRVARRAARSIGRSLCGPALRPTCPATALRPRCEPSDLEQK
jgi:hypothetical protein